MIKYLISAILCGLGFWIGTYLVGDSLMPGLMYYLAGITIGWLIK
jgi:hypothetical protein